MGLESPSVHWYVVLEEEGVTLAILSGLREGTQLSKASSKLGNEGTGVEQVAIVREGGG